jgi:DNA-binding CsgD family transcriptional regulator
VIALTKPVDARVLDAVFKVLEESQLGTSTVSSFATRHGLSPQETRLLRLALQEVTNKEAAYRLGCTHSTVRSYWARIFRKVGCRTERDVVSRLFRQARRNAVSNEGTFETAPAHAAGLLLPAAFGGLHGLSHLEP